MQKNLDVTKPLSEHIFSVPWLGWIEINANVCCMLRIVQISAQQENQNAGGAQKSSSKTYT